MDHFEAKFKESDMNRSVLEGGSVQNVELGRFFSLECPFEEDEIKEAVWSCEGSKSPGPDGYSLLSIKKCWKFIKKDVVSCFRDFHCGEVLSKSIISSFLA